MRWNDMPEIPRIARVAALIAAPIVAVPIALVVLVFQPAVLFEYDREIGGYPVLSAGPIPPLFERVVAEAHSLIADSEIYRPEAKIQIVLSHGHMYNALAGESNIAYAAHLNAVLAGEIDTAQTTLTWEKSGVRMNLVPTLAHELVHCLQVYHHGFLQYNITDRAPPWKKEGYAEYVSQRQIREHPDYDLSSSISTLLAYRGNSQVPGWIVAEDGFDRPLPYYRSRLLVEYLLDTEGLGYAGIMSNSVQEDATYGRMMDWRRATAEQNASPSTD